MNLDKDAQRLIENCMRGGTAAYYWYLKRAKDPDPEQKKTHWFDTSILVNPPNYGDGFDLYLSLIHI